MGKTIVSLNSHLIVVKWDCTNLGQSYVSIKSIDLNKTVRVNRDYGFSDNRQVEYILNKLGLNFIGKSSDLKKDFFMYTWDFETLENNFNKKNLNS